MSTEAVLRAQRRGTLCSAVSTVHNHGGHTESFQSKRMGLDLKEAEGLKRTPILMGRQKTGASVRGNISERAYGSCLVAGAGVCGSVEESTDTPALTTRTG